MILGLPLSPPMFRLWSGWMRSAGAAWKKIGFSKKACRTSMESGFQPFGIFTTENRTDSFLSIAVCPWQALTLARERLCFLLIGFKVNCARPYLEG